MADVDRAVAEARAPVPEIVGVATKVGLDLEAARSLAPGRARRLIWEGVVPVRPAPPYRLEVEGLAGREGRRAGYLRRGVEQIDERAARPATDDAPRVFA